MSQNLDRRIFVGGVPNPLPCEWANEAGRVKRFQGCDQPATERIKWVLGVNYYCKRHAFLVSGIEAEWDKAEAEEFSDFGALE